jgi:hypothetical protein
MAHGRLSTAVTKASSPIHLTQVEISLLIQSLLDLTVNLKPFDLLALKFP